MGNGYVNGHLPALGWRWTKYGRHTAMHGALNLWTPWGYFCACWSRRFGWYLYLSPNATPGFSTWYVGSRWMAADERRMVRVRRALWGHGYDCERLDPHRLNEAVLTVERWHIAPAVGTEGEG